MTLFLVQAFPDIAKQLHPTKNVGIDIHKLAAYANKKLWWQCEKEHEWEAKVANRTAHQSRCPYCSGKKILVGETDLNTTHPTIATQWHPTKNGTIIAAGVSAGSNKKFWWLDEFGHEWEATVNSRVGGKTGCPYCAGTALIRGQSDLASQNPTIANQWHPTKNMSLTPSDVHVSSAKKAWWLDELGHEWEAAIYSRTVGKNGCPYCGNRKVLPGFNDVLHSQLAHYWDYDANTVSPDTVISNSTKSYSWTNSTCKHSWKRTAHEMLKNDACPYCSGRTLLNNFNDLKTLFPLVAAEWDYKHNEGHKPEEFTAGSKFKADWICAKKHTWKTAIHVRTAGSNCPECVAATANYVSQGEKDIAKFLNALNIPFVQSNRSVLKNLELDFYIASHNLAIEFNGLYWHSEEAGKSPKYHYEKWLAAKNQGVQLLQIWEDDWLSRKEIVLRAIAHKLGKSSEFNTLYPEYGTPAKIYARKTSIQHINTRQAKDFFEKHHIQGFASGSYYLALADSDDKVRAVLTLRKEQQDVLNIIRYATAGTVAGGFTKLLKYAERTYQPSSFITFADHTISDGKLYENNGFVQDKELPPDYMYVIKNKRQHKFGYRLKRFQTDPNLKWEKGLSESQLAKLNKISRVWDAGKTRYKYIPKTN